MRKTKILIIVQTVLLCLFASMANAEMSSSSFRIPTSVMSSGSNTMSSTNFHVVSTLGQPTVLGKGLSTNYSSYPGFWYTLLLNIAVGDVNGDGAVSLEDVIITLQIATGQTTEAIYLEADADGDSRIGLSESIMILRKLGNL